MSSSVRAAVTFSLGTVSSWYAALSESGWQAAQHLELLPSVEVAATGEDELRAASRYEGELVRSRQLGGPQHRR